MAVTAYAPPVPIAAHHRLDGFRSGHDALDHWLLHRGLANEGRSSRTYVVMRRDEPDLVVAYYALASGSVLRAGVARRLRHDLPGEVPILLLGRVAVDRAHAGRGLGSAMLSDALRRTVEVSRTVGVRMLMVHAIDDVAAAFYRRYGFEVFPVGSRTLYLPMETIVASL